MGEIPILTSIFFFGGDHNMEYLVAFNVTQIFNRLSEQTELDFYGLGQQPKLIKQTVYSESKPFSSIEDSIKFLYEEICKAEKNYGFIFEFTFPDNKKNYPIYSFTCDKTLDKSRYFILSASIHITDTEYKELMLVKESLKKDKMINPKMALTNAMKKLDDLEEI